MMGLIWYVQLVHYPSFSFVSAENFADFHLHHSVKTGLIVMPIMILEITTSGALWWKEGYLSANAIGFYLVLLIWASTFFLSVPYHNLLSLGKDVQVIDKLVATNWIRTALWTVKSLLSGWILFKL